LKKADMEYMQRAIELATQARGRTSPNPMVGAVIVKDGKIIGEGYHKKAGTPHAEIHALAAAGNEARGATLYVSLEPCCHHGRTPPCTEAIINSGIKRVVIAALDPNPKVAGGGLQRLKEAGIDAEFGLMQEAAMELNAVFFKYIQRALPYVALKTAMTLDGKIAAGSGDSRWITGPEARQHVHQLRNIYDAIMVGIGTVLADNPRLNTRLQEGQGRDPVRVIIDNQLDLPVNSIIAQSSREQPSLVFCGKEIDEHKASELSRLGVEIIKTDLENDHKLRCHLFMFKLNGEQIKAIWMSSALHRPIYSLQLTDLDQDGKKELRTQEGSYSLLSSLIHAYDDSPSLWQWQGWGFRKLETALPL
jgi:diaminohydroxyphosphoribosylaminopyrimidine deaminase/5-amino-6-(5-phosphoribosylamino)uracil reductase